MAVILISFKEKSGRWHKDPYFCLKWAKMVFLAYNNIERSAQWCWMFIISTIKHCRKNNGMALKPCSFRWMIQPEAVLFFTRFSLLGNGKKNVGKCTNVVSSVLAIMTVHLNPEFGPVCQFLCSQDTGGKAQGFFLHPLSVISKMSAKHF